MRSTRDTIKIIFNLKGRKKYTTKYLELLKFYCKKEQSFDLLIINENKNNVLDTNDKPIKIINLISKKPINGMNDIFREMFNSKNILLRYKYCCFVEDDNFIFPNFILKSKIFLENNKSFASCSGNCFLYVEKNKSNFTFLKKYLLPNNIHKININDRFIKYNGTLCYYNLFRSEIFIRILFYIDKIKDDNLSEIFFNYLSLISGRNNYINTMHLARFWPRPNVYNIPNKTNWIVKKELFIDIKYIIKVLTYNKPTISLDNSIFKYLSLRFKKKQKLNIFKRVFYTFDNNFFYLINLRFIRKYLVLVNKP